MSHFSFWFDAPIVGLYLIATMAAGIYVRKYVGKVEHFLVAGREMNVYLGIASLAATEFGIVTCMYTSEESYRYGFAGATSGICQAVAMFLIGITGFCIKPLRDSGVITIPELLEKQFGSRVRWAAGVVIITGGLLNMGVFLRVGGEFLLRVTGLNTAQFPIVKFGAEGAAGFGSTGFAAVGGFPHALNVVESATVRADDSSIVWMMTVMLIMVAVYTIMGGMLSVLVTDFLQFVVMSIGLIAVTILILVNVGWDALAATVTQQYQSGGFNPIANKELGWPAVIFWTLLNGAATLTWQTTIARVLAAKDTNTGRKIYTRTSFFFVCRFVIPGIWGVAALTYFYNKGIIVPDDQKLYAMPHYLAQAVPFGLMGLLVAAMLAADMSTDSSYMLTWGSVIYNDLLAPFHKRRWSEKTGLLWNRCIVAGIGVFLFFFGLMYKFEGAVWDYLGVTGTIYLSSMATLLIACCYWKRANSWGAYGAIACGALFPIVYLILQKIDPKMIAQWMAADHSAVVKLIGTPIATMIDAIQKSRFYFLIKSPFYSGIAAYAAAAIAMVVGSFLKDLKNLLFPSSAAPTTTQEASS